MKYTEQEESRLLEIMEDFCKPQNIYSFEQVELSYAGLDHHGLPFPERILEFAQEKLGEEKLSEQEKEEILPHRFTSKYFQSLGGLLDKGLLLSEIILHAEKEGFRYFLVNDEKVRMDSTNQVIANPDFKNTFGLFLTDKLNERAANQTLERHVTFECRVVPFAYLEKDIPGRPSKEIDIFGMKLCEEQDYENIFVASTESNRIIRIEDVSCTEQEKKFEELTRYLRL